MAQGDIQTNVRLPPDLHEVLEAAAYVHKTGSVQKLIKQLLQEATDQYRQLPTVQKALEAQREHLAVEKGKVALLSKQRQGGQED
jgi:c-di-AMP phosphodiesterase-like protein